MHFKKQDYETERPRPDANVKLARTYRHVEKKILKLDVLDSVERGARAERSGGEGSLGGDERPDETGQGRAGEDRTGQNGTERSGNGQGKDGHRRKPRYT